MDENGLFYFGQIVSVYVVLVEGLEIDLKLLEVIGIIFDYLFWLVKEEKVVLDYIFILVCVVMKKYGCQCVILVGYNVYFDFGFVNVVVVCIGYKCNLFYLFSVFDMVILVGIVYGQIVLVCVVMVVGLGWDVNEVYSVVYDIEQIVWLFCIIVNVWLC